MARVKTFRLNPDYGVPDKEIREWLTLMEQEENAVIGVEMIYIPRMGNLDPKLVVVAMKVDEGFRSSD